MSRVEFIPSNIDELDDEFYHVRELLHLIKDEDPNIVVFHTFEYNSQSNFSLVNKLTNDDLVILSDDGLFIIRVFRDLKKDNKSGKYLHKSFDSLNYMPVDSPISFINEQKYKFIDEFSKLPHDKENKIICCGGIALTMSKLEKSSIDIDEKMVFSTKNGINFMNYLNDLREHSSKLKQLSSKTKNYSEIKYVIFRSREEIKKDLKKILEIKDIYTNPSETYRLSNEQRDNLKLLNESEFAIVRGGAGTGKTELAIELVEKLKKHGFEKIVYFTFNKLLADEIKTISSKKYPNLEFEVYPIKDYFVDFAKKCGKLRDEFNPEELEGKEKGKFYDIELQKIMFNALKVNSPNYEVIIVDQAQDIINTAENLMIVSLLLEKRMNGGRFYFFGDFKNQLLFDNVINKNKFKQMILGITSKKENEIVDIELTYNFRSSKKIINALNSIIEDTYIDKYKSKEEGALKFISISNDEELTEKIDNKISELLNKYSKKQITILSNSTCREDELKDLTIFKKLKFYDDISLLTEDNNDKIKLAKIRRYKGMENEVVLLVDLNAYIPSGKTESSKDILYTGISRAKKEAYVFETDKDREASEVLAPGLVKEYE